MESNRFLLFTFSLLLFTSVAHAAEIKESLALAKGWNGVYLEATPNNADCDQFFAALPVTQVGAYVSEAYDDTEQYSSDGSERNQKPVSYKVWNRDGRSSLTSLKGGMAYLIFATNACETTYFGVPRPPRFTWRKASATDTEAIINLIGVSLPAGTSLYASTYFLEGPYGAKGTLYTIGGTEGNPSFKAPFTSSSAKVAAGKAYGVTAGAACRWPGVIEVSADAVTFEADANTAEIRLTNRGTSARTVRVTYTKGEGAGDVLLPILRRIPNDGALGSSWSNVTANVSWEVALEPGASEDLVFGIERATLNKSSALGGLLVFNDLGSTQMRVRVPVSVEFPSAEASAAVYPTGLWLGKFVFSRVTYNEETTPVEAEGLLKPTVIFHVDDEKRMQMLQRVSLVTETNGLVRLFRSLASARKVNDSARRLTSLMLDPSNQVVNAASGIFGEETRFAYTVEPTSAGNPFRHVWHPDHDGLNATYDAPAAVGAELWSVTNTVTMQFRDLGSGADFYSSDVDEIRAGRVLWTVEGLRHHPITAEGVFSIQRLVPANEIEL